MRREGISGGGGAPGAIDQTDGGWWGRETPSSVSPISAPLDLPAVCTNRVPGRHWTCDNISFLISPLSPYFSPILQVVGGWLSQEVASPSPSPLIPFTLQVAGGWLSQEADSLSPEEVTFTVVSEAQPTEQQLKDVKFAWR